MFSRLLAWIGFGPRKIAADRGREAREAGKEAGDAIVAALDGYFGGDFQTLSHQYLDILQRRLDALAVSGAGATKLTLEAEFRQFCEQVDALNDDVGYGAETKVLPWMDPSLGLRDEIAEHIRSRTIDELMALKAAGARLVVAQEMRLSN